MKSPIIPFAVKASRFEGHLMNTSKHSMMTVHFVQCSWKATGMHLWQVSPSGHTGQHSKDGTVCGVVVAGSAATSMSTNPQREWQCWDKCLQPMGYHSSWSLTMCLSLFWKNFQASVSSTGLNTFGSHPITLRQMVSRRGSFRCSRLLWERVRRMAYHFSTAWLASSSSTVPLFKERQQHLPLYCSWGEEGILCTHLDLRMYILWPHTHIRAEENQAGQKQEHDQHSRPRFQQDGQPVLVCNIHGRLHFIPDTIVKAVGPVSFIVQTTAGLSWKRHLDHIQARMETSPVAVEPADEGED